MPETKRPIFQPVLGDIATPTYIQQGVVDTSTAEAIKAAGKTGIAAWQGYEESKVKKEVEQEVGDLFYRKAVEFESEIPIEDRLTGAAQQTRMLAEEGFGEEDPAITEMSGSLSKLGRAKEIGAIDELEFKARVQAAVRRGISRMPGRADTFRKIANDILGDNSANIEQVFAIEKEQAASVQAQAKEYQKFLQRASTYNGLPPHMQTEATLQDYQADLAAKNAEAQAKVVDARTLRTEDEKIKHVSGVGLAMSISATTDVYNVINSGQVKGMSIAEYRATHGDAALERAIAEDEVARQDFLRNASASVNNARLAINNYYNVQAKNLGINITRFGPELEAQLKVIDQLDDLLKSDLDSSQISNLFNILNLQNKTRVEKIMQSAPTLSILRVTGGIREASQAWFTDKDSFRRIYGDSAANDFESVFGPNGSVQLQGFVTDQTTAVAKGEITLPQLAKTSPLAANITRVQADNHIRMMKERGFGSDRPENVKKQKDTFVTFSQAILDTISPDNPNSLRVLSDTFGDSRYQELIKELDAPQRERLVGGVLSKYNNVIGSKDDGISLLGRISKSEAKVREETVRTGSEIKPKPQVVIKNGRLVSNFEDRPTGLLDFTSVSAGHFKDHIDAVARLNRMVEDQYKVISTFEKVPSYSDFLKGFYNEKIRVNNKED